MKFELLQNEKPTNKWLVKDTNKDIIRNISDDIKDVNNLTDDEEKCIKMLIDFVRVSQDKTLNKADSEDYLRPAVGLAAPQIGVNKNMFYAKFEWTDEGEVDNKEFAMINAKIIARSEQIMAISDGEGCLSVDGDKEGYVPRNYKIVVEGYDYITKQNVTLNLRGYKSIVFQHELDHNVGKLYYDHINKTNPWLQGENWLYL